MLYTENEALNVILKCNHRPKVVLMCGLAGSGKTTFAKRLERLHYERLSIDEEIWRRFGRYGVDYPKEEYQNLQTKANKALHTTFLKLLKHRQNIVVDFSFWQKKKRDTYKQIIDDYGGKSFLIYMNTPISIIKKRLEVRNKRFEPNAAFPITEEILDEYIKGFEIPQNENQFEIIPPDISSSRVPK